MKQGQGILIKKGQKVCSFIYSVVNSKNYISFTYIAFNLPRILAWALGFTKTLFIANTQNDARRTVKYANSVPGYKAHLDYCYIYMNIVTPTHVSNQRNNILRILPIDTSYGHVLSKDFTNTMYFKCNTSGFVSRLFTIFE